MLSLLNNNYVPAFGSERKLYTLIDAEGKPYKSEKKGTLGGYKPKKIYGKLDCPSAHYWLKKGHYAKHRVFFVDEKTAVKAGYRPCAKCLPSDYKYWKENRDQFKQKKLSVHAQ